MRVNKLLWFGFFSCNKYRTFDVHHAKKSNGIVVEDKEIHVLSMTLKDLHQRCGVRHEHPP